MQIHMYTHGICTTHIIYIVYVLYTYTHGATVCADADACAAPPFVSAALLLTNSIPPPLQPNHHCSESLRCAMVQHNTVSIINVQSCALACLICVYCMWRCNASRRNTWSVNIKCKYKKQKNLNLTYAPHREVYVRTQGRINNFFFLYGMFSKKKMYSKNISITFYRFLAGTESKKKRTQKKIYFLLKRNMKTIICLIQANTIGKLTKS